MLLFLLLYYHVHRYVLWMDGKGCLREEDHVLGLCWIVYIIHFTKLGALEKYLLEKMYNGLKQELKRDLKISSYMLPRCLL